MNIALISPNKNAYSETFIQAHKMQLKGNVFYYFNGEIPTKLEGGLVINSRRKRIVDIFKGHFNLNRFSLAEQAVITSFKKNKIDLVFAEYGGTGQRILSICQYLNLPLIVHFHGFDAARYDQLEQNQNYKKLFDAARFVIAVSRIMYQDLLNLGCPKDKLIYNVSGPREEFFSVDPGFEAQQFLWAGRFVNKKAPYYLILSFLEVLKKFPNAQLLMAGDGELWNTCKNLVKFYQIENNVNFLGVINEEEFRKHLKESTAFIQHSITAANGDKEGTPLSVLEASAAGLPVLSTRHAGIPDVIIQGETGLLVEEHDVQGMANNMITLLADKDLAKRMGLKGKENIKKNYSLSRHIALLDDLIEKVKGTPQ
ncbi:glycosyltransferase [Salegentibacter agarivorans]